MRKEEHDHPGARVLEVLAVARGHTHTLAQSSRLRLALVSSLSPTHVSVSVGGGRRLDDLARLHRRRNYNTSEFNLGRNLADVHHNKQVISSANVPAACRTKHSPTS